MNLVMTFATVNPASGRVEKTFEDHGPEEVERRLARALQAFRAQRTSPLEERARSMRALADLLDAEQPDLARTLTTEMGKTFASARAEVSKCAMACRWFADHAAELLSEEKIDSKASRSWVRYEPLGAVLAIMPWNFPLWQVIRFAAPAIMAGNVGILKHAPNVPQTSLALEDLFRRAGFAEGVFTNLFVDTPVVAELIADERIAAVTLTGSERAGAAVGAAAGRAIKKCVLELGGSDPFVVLEPAELDKVVPQAVQARIQNNGQSCIAGKRFLVDAPLYDEFLARFTGAMEALVVGDPMDPATEVGPLVNEAQRDQLAAQVDDARERGATVHCGGAVVDGPGWYYRPTVLTGVTAEMRAGSEELFGPVAVVQRVEGVEEALAVANATAYGLGSSVWTSDGDLQETFVQGVEAGQVFVNAMVASTPELPFGGIKHSGYGRELSRLGIHEFCNAKAVWMA